MKYWVKYKVLRTHTTRASNVANNKKQDSAVFYASSPKKNVCVSTQRGKE